jgi:hypothetical protein
MTLLSRLGIAEDKQAKRIEYGEGIIYSRTIQLADDVIAIDNIGSIMIIDKKRDHNITIIASVLTLLGILILVLKMASGSLLLIGGIGLGIWNLTRKMETYLSIGTADGRSTIIVSKDREFLKKISNFLREKIDSKSTASATINITNSTLDGTISIGNHPTAITSNK